MINKILKSILKPPKADSGEFKVKVICSCLMDISDLLQFLPFGQLLKHFDNFYTLTCSFVCHLSLQNKTNLKEQDTSFSLLVSFSKLCDAFMKSKTEMFSDLAAGWSNPPVICQTSVSASH